MVSAQLPIAQDCNLHNITRRKSFILWIKSEKLQ